MADFCSAVDNLHPDQAIGAIVQAVEAYVAREHPRNSEMLDAEVLVDGRAVRLREDWSHIWAHDPESNYGNDAEALIKKLLEYLRSADAAAVTHIAERLVETSSLAIFWSRLFLVATERDDALIDLLLPIAMQEDFLTLPDTRKDAVDVVAKGYSRLPHATREAFEAAVSQFDFSLFQRPDDARASFELRLFGAIGAANLASDAARTVATERGDIDDVQNDRLFVVRTTSGSPEPYHWIQDLDHQAPANQTLMAAIDRTKEVLGLETDPHDGSTTTLEASLESMEALAADIDRETQDPLLVIYAEGQISRGIDRLVDRKLVPVINDNATTVRFLHLFNLAATSAGPPLHNDTETDFERGASWGSPAPRVDAAETALDLTLQRPDLYLGLQPTIDQLLRDRHPAVRLQAALRLVRIWDLDREGFWSRLSSRVADESNQSVIDHVCASVLRRILHEDAERTEPLALTLLDRFPDEPERQARMRKALSDLLAIFWVTYEREDSHAVLESWISDAASHNSELSKILGTLRGAFIAGLTGQAEPKDKGLRRRSQAIASEIVAAANKGLEAYFQLEAPSPKEMELGRSYAQLLDIVCRELFFASGAGRDNSNTEGSPSGDELAVFFDEVGDTLAAIGDFATPHTVYYLLQLLEHLLPVDPARAFDLTTHALRSGGKRTGYQFESMGADLLVRLVGMFLADHKELFEDDDRRTALIDCLEIFMDAGWPAARRLLYRLPELIQ